MTSSVRTRLAVLLVALLALAAGCESKPTESTADQKTETAQKEQPSTAGEEAAPQEDEETAERGPSENAAAAIPTEEELAEMEPPPGGERPEFIVGETTPREVLETYPNWLEWYEEARPTEEGIEKLASLSEDATVTVYFGTWCGDSRRELARFWKALGEAERVELKVEYVALNPDFEAGEVEIEDEKIMYVPTFVVKKNGDEVGRIVESSPNGVENDLFDLLSGNAEGVITKREDL